MFLPEPVRKQAFAEPETRAEAARPTWPRPSARTFHRRWDLVRIVKVARPEHAGYVGQSVADDGRRARPGPARRLPRPLARRGPGDHVLDGNTGGDPEAMGEILRSPYVLVGQSDAGAHVQFDAAFGYGTTLLGQWVRERGVLTLEQAIHKLTFQVASVYGLRGPRPAPPRLRRRPGDLRSRPPSTPASRSGPTTTRPTRAALSSAPTACTTRSSTARSSTTTAR